MKLINAILAILFALFAIVQYNDPDPWLWIIAYSAMAILSASAIFLKINRFIIIGAIALFSIWGLLLLPDFWNWLQHGAPSIASEMKASEPHIELTREFLGIIICLATLFFHWKKNATA